MGIRALPVIAVIAGVLFLPATASSQQANPLAPFERLIGGQWQLEGSYQEFEWGVGRRSVKARSYFVVDGEPKLVSEGVWFWHPGEQAIKGVVTAIDMPVVLFDYTTWFEGDRMVSELRSYDAEGAESPYVETFEFTQTDQYVWRLFKPTADGLEEEMSGTYSRRQ
jgi:hypothetical protein